MKKIFILCLFAVCYAMAAKKSVAVFPCWGDLNDKELKQLRFKIETIGENTLLQGGGFKFIQHDLLDKGIDNKKVYIACKEGGTCVGDLTRDANADYGTWCQVEKTGGKLILYFQLFDNEENSNLYTNMFRDLKNVDDVLKIIDNEIPTAFKRILPKEPPPPSKPSPVVATKPPTAAPVPPPKPKYVPPVEPEPIAPIIKKNKLEEYDERIEKVKKLIKKGVEKNKEEIQKESSILWAGDREILYMDNEKKAAGWWIALNVDPSFGLGSYIQGDIWTGLALSSSEILGISLVAIGMAYMKNSKVAIAALGTSIAVTSYVNGIIAPLRYQKKYNKTLKDALNINKDQRGFEKVQELIDMGVEKNKEKIQKESSSLSPDEKGLLWKNNEKKAAGWLAFANLYPFLAVGSYIQGNMVFGVIQSTLQIGGIFAAEASHKTLGNIMLGSGVAIGLIAPFVYQSRYNKSLKDVLNIDDNYDNFYDSFSYSIEPLIVPRDGTPAVGLAFNVRY
ncbi:MAG: P13 family porin [Fibromonadales bacterium]|nr:P13 family porin [Fibromonadales bacterium]